MIDSRAGHVYGLYAGQQVMLIIPRDAFSDMDQQKAFAAFVQGKLAQATDGACRAKARIFDCPRPAPLTKVPQM